MFEKSLKLALVVFLSVRIGKILSIESPFYAGIAAAITLQSGFTDSLHAGKNRIIGTGIGALIGITFAYIVKGDINYCWIGIFLISIICNKFGLEKTISIACIVFLAININFYGEVRPEHYSLYRIADTSLGIGVVTVVNLGHDLIKKIRNTQI